LLNRDKQSAEIQRRKIVTLNPLFSGKTFTPRFSRKSARRG
jgi:hypothetical protein